MEIWCRCTTIGILTWEQSIVTMCGIPTKISNYRGHAVAAAFPAPTVKRSCSSTLQRSPPATAPTTAITGAVQMITKAIVSEWPVRTVEYVSGLTMM